MTLLIIFVLVFLNFILLMNHFKVIKKLSSLNFDEIEILREEDLLSGEKLQGGDL